MSFYWNAEHPESRYDKLELNVADARKFEELPTITLTTTRDYTNKRQLLIKFTLFIASKVLTDKQLQIFVMRYFLQMKQEDIGEKLDVSQSYISIVSHRCQQKVETGIQEYIHQKTEALKDQLLELISAYFKETSSIVCLGGFKNLSSIKQEIFKEIETKVLNKIEKNVDSLVEQILFVTRESLLETKGPNDYDEINELLREFTVLIEEDLSRFEHKKVKEQENKLSQLKTLETSDHLREKIRWYLEEQDLNQKKFIEDLTRYKKTIRRLESHL